MRNPTLMFFLILGVSAGLAYGLYKATQPNGESPVVVDNEPEQPPGPPMPTFQLTRSDGTSFDSAELRGQVWVSGFFFTSCTGPCYKMMKALADQQDFYRAKRIKTVSITCDPSTDTGEVLERYAKLFDADLTRWWFLRGELDDVRTVAIKSFHIALDEQTHSERVLLVDRLGRIRGSFNATKPEQMDALKRLAAKVVKEPIEPEGAAANAREAPSGKSG